MVNQKKIQKGTRQHHNKTDNLEGMNALQTWKALTGQQEEMDEEGFSMFITQTLGLPEDTLLQFYFMSIVMKGHKLGHIKFEHFQNLFRCMGNCKTIKELKKLLPKMEKQLDNPNVYKQMYRNLFDVFLTKTLCIDFETAEVLWGVLLKKDFIYLKEFQQYLEYLDNKKPTKCHKDLWNMMHEFALEVKDIKKDYREGDAWPVFIDNFVQYLHEKNLV